MIAELDRMWLLSEDDKLMSVVLKKKEKLQKKEKKKKSEKKDSSVRKYLKDLSLCIKRKFAKVKPTENLHVVSTHHQVLDDAKTVYYLLPQNFSTFI